MNIEEIKETQWGGQLSMIYHVVLRYAWGDHVDSYKRVKELFDEAFVWHEEQVKEGYLQSYGGKPFSPESRQTIAQEIYEKMAQIEHRFPEVVERLKVIMDGIGKDADKIELK